MIEIVDKKHISILHELVEILKAAELKEKELIALSKPAP